MNDKHPNAAVITKVGDEAKNFALADTDETIVSLSAVLEQTPAILVFYRGDW